MMMEEEDKDEDEDEPRHFGLSLFVVIGVVLDFADIIKRPLKL